MTIAVETKQKIKSFEETGGKCICFNLRKASRVMTQVYDEAIRSTGYRVTQFMLIGATAKLEPITVTDLAETVCMDRTTLTRNLKPLEKQGVLKVTVGEDRRERVVVITDKGRKLMAKAMPIIERTARKVHEIVGEDRIERLLKDLNLALSAVRAGK